MRLPLILACAVCAVTAQASLAQTMATDPAASAPAGSPAAPPSKGAQSDWEGAVGLIADHSPSYLGAAGSAWSLKPGLFVRYGRFSLTTHSGFATRRDDELERGVTAELLHSERLRISLSARFDGGRDAGSDVALTGLSDLRATLRARLSAVQQLGGGWRLGLAVSPDVLGRGGGTTLDASLVHEWRLSPTLLATAGLASTWADKTYQQNYFGITAAQSLSSGYPAYAPAAGLRDIGVSAGLRIDLGPQWIAFASAQARQMQGPSRNSPLTQRRAHASASAGLAWRF